MQVVVMQLGPEEFRVLVDDAGRRSEHTVRLPRHAREGLGLARIPPTVLVEESFRFLLERRAPSDIAGAFVLPTIAAEHPEYPEEIRTRLA